MILRSFLIVSLSLVWSLTATGQEGKLCDHLTTSRERFDAIRLLPPVKVLNFDGRTIDYSYEDARGVYVGSFTVTGDSELPKDFGKRYKAGYWWVLYCVRDLHLYSVHALGPEQKKALK